MIEVTMPRLSDSMEEGTIVAWLKADGDEVSRGDELAEIETDKATMTYEADADGFLHIVAREGDTLPVGAMIAQLLADPDEQPRTDRPASDTDANSSSSASAGPDPLLPPRGPGHESVSAVLTRVKVSPLARRLAREHAIEIQTLAGSGRDGRIVKADVEAAVAANGAAPASTAPAAKPEPATAPAVRAPEPAPAAEGEVEVVELTRTQTLIARRMAESRATIPEFTVSVEVDTEALFALRDELRGQAKPLPSVNDFVIKAAGLALREHPRANGSYRDGRFELYSRVNVGMAVAAEGSLVVPTIFDADQKSITQIARETRALADRVRDGSVTPPELAGGTFTVSNLGMFGVSRFTAVINAPQAAILAVGAAIARAVPDEVGRLRARRVMELTLSADHRILYGADAAAFLGSVRTPLEKPLRLLV
jgi:pyruvate dehydrogenase E2 component (dihydrolipoamide acetyltransferase)